MSGRVATRLAELQCTLPTPAVAVANYVPFTRSGNQIHVSGQLPKIGDQFITGKLGAGLTVEDGQKAAKMCIVNFMAQLNAALGGNLDRVRKVVKLNIFVNCAPEFVDQPKVANGASDFMVEVFGEVGTHARSAVGVASLPLGAAVEIDGIVEIVDEKANL